MTEWPRLSSAATASPASISSSATGGVAAATRFARSTRPRCKTASPKTVHALLGPGRGDGVDHAKGQRFLRRQPAWRAELRHQAFGRQPNMLHEGGAPTRALVADSLGMAGQVRHVA